MSRTEFTEKIRVKRLHFAEFKCEGICTAPTCERQVRSARASYCHMHYSRLRRGSELGLNPRNSVCGKCGDPLPQNRDKYCSAKCLWRAGRQTIAFKVCRLCGNRFENNSVALHCSQECMEANIIEVRRESSKRYRGTPAAKEAFRNKELIRKARKNNVLAEEFDRQEIFERDGWRCGLCHKKISKKAKWPEPGFGTIDHILPLSKGGIHARVNVQAAHLKCNCSKNSRVIGQLRLFG